MLAVSSVRPWLWLLALATVCSCSSHDVSLGDSADPRPEPEPEPEPRPVITCDSVPGQCMANVTGACVGGVWSDAECGSSELECCVLPAPQPMHACELNHGSCIHEGDACRGRLATGDRYACGAGDTCCVAYIGTGQGGASGTAAPPGGHGGEP